MKNNFKAIATKTLLAAAIASAVSGAAFAAEEEATATNQTLTDELAVVKAPAATGDAVADSAYFSLDQTTLTVNSTDYYGKSAAVAGVEAKYDAKTGLDIQGGTISGFENTVLNLTGIRATTITDTTFKGNSVGSVIDAHGTLTLDNVTFDSNTAGTYKDNGSVNTKEKGGAIVIRNNSSAFVTGSASFIGNTATENGGAIGIWGGATVVDQNTYVVDLNKSVFSGNKAASGGAVYIQGQKVRFTDTDFSNNTAAAYGGAVRANGGAVEFVVTKGQNLAYTGNTTGTTDQASTLYTHHTGGFLYLQSGATAKFDVANNATLTIGTAGADTDSIASLYETVAKGDDKVPTITKTGAGDLIVHGDMSGFVGTVNVTGGSMVIDGGIGEYDIATQMALNDKGAATATVGTTTLTVDGADATLTVGDINMAGNLAVNVTKGDFTAGNITVTKTTYQGTVEAQKDKKAELSGDVAFTIAADQAANVESITLNDKDAKFGVTTAGAMNVAGNVVVNGGKFTATQKEKSTTGYVAINGDLQVLNGSASIGVDTDATNLVIGKAAVGTEKATTGSVTITAGGSLAVDKITFAAEDSKLKFEKDAGALETSSDQIYSGTGENVKEVKGYDFMNGSLILTDATFDKTKWDDLKTALGKLNGSGIDYYFDTATYVTAGDETLSHTDLQKYKRVGHAVVVRGGRPDTTNMNSLTALGEGEFVLGGFDFKAADGKETETFGVGGTESDITFRGTETGEVFINAGAATIKLTNVHFGQEDTDHGTITNKVELGTDSEVRNGNFTFGEVVLNQFDLSAQKGATLTVASVDDQSTGALDANGGTVKYIGKTNKDGYLDVYGVAQVRQAGTYIAGNYAYAGMEDTNALYIGQKTNFHQGITFGAADENSQEANAIVLDMASIANSGFDVDKDVVVKVKDNQTTVNSTKKVAGTASIHLINKDKRITTSHADRDGFVTYTLKAGTLGENITDVVLENEGNLFGDEYDAQYSKDNGTITVVALRGEQDGEKTDYAYDYLMASDSAAGYAAAQALKTWDTDQFGLLSLTKDDVAQKLGYENATDAGTQVIEDSIDYILKSADEVMLGAVASGAFTAGFDYNYEVAKTLDRRMTIANLNAARNPSGLTPWVDVFGSANEAKSLFSSDGGNYGYEADVYGAVLGFDWVAPCGAIIGAAVNVGTADANSVGDFYTKSDSDSDYYGFSIYGAHRIGNFNGKVDFGYIHAKNDITTKSSFLGSFSESLDADIFTFGLGAEYLANVGSLNIVPHAGIRWSRLDMDESKYGADYDAMNLFQMPMGVTFSGTFDMTGWKVAPMLDISVVPAFGDKDAVATFAGGFEDTTRVVDSNPVQMTLGVNAQVDAWTLGVNYGLSAGSDERLNNSFNLNARYTF